MSQPTSEIDHLWCNIYIFGNIFIENKKQSLCFPDERTTGVTVDEDEDGPEEDIMSESMDWESEDEETVLHEKGDMYMAFATVKGKYHLIHYGIIE